MATSTPIPSPASSATPAPHSHPGVPPLSLKEPKKASISDAFVPPVASPAPVASPSPRQDKVLTAPPTPIGPSNADLNLNSIAFRMHSHAAVISFVQNLMMHHKKFNDIIDKFDAIDVAYARYNISKNRGTVDGIDTAAGNVNCNIFDEDDVTPPIVVSQVDSTVAYLAEVFLSGSPIFPVVSNPLNKDNAEKLEALLDNHSRLGGYPRQLLLFLRNCAKYNFAALEVPWESIEQFSVLEDLKSVTAGQKMGRTKKKFSKIKNLNPRNVIWDWSVPAGDVSEHGDYAGYLEKMTKTKLKKLLNKFNEDGKLMNADKALASATTVAVGNTPNFKENPLVSNYLSSAPGGRAGGFNWDVWFDAGANNKNGQRTPVSNGQVYEVLRLYARIMPADFGIAVPNKNHPQIWKFVVVNNQHVVFADRIISAYDYLPILFGSPLEDSMDYQTQSIAEGEIPFQKAANTLFNIRFAAARRAVSDRALYLPDMIKPSDINSPVPAPKIPVQISQLSQKGIQDAYHQIPFDMRGTESTIQDASLIVSFSKDLHGINNPQQGQFQKGNKSVQEWNDTMAGSDGRLRLPALTLEHQVFSPLKAMLVLNIFQYGDDTAVISQETGNKLDINIAELRADTLDFEVADGYTPKSKVAATDVLIAGINLIAQSPILQQAYGAFLPGMFAHFMSLSGVKGFDQYNPQSQTVAPPGGLQTAALQPGPTETNAAGVPQPGIPVGGSAAPVTIPGSEPVAQSFMGQTKNTQVP